MNTESVPSDRAEPNTRISDNPDVCVIEAALSTYAGGPAWADVNAAWARLKAIIHDPCFAPTPPPVQAVTREELEELINRELRSYELYGGNILDAIATYHNDETVKEALETVGDWSVWLAETIISRLNPTEPK